MRINQIWWRLSSTNSRENMKLYEKLPLIHIAARITQLNIAIFFFRKFINLRRHRGLWYIIFFDRCCKTIIFFFTLEFQLSSQSNFKIDAFWAALSFVFWATAFVPIRRSSISKHTGVVFFNRQGTWLSTLYRKHTGVEILNRQRTWQSISVLLNYFLNQFLKTIFSFLYKV